MGYLTDYKLTASGFQSVDELEFFEFKLTKMSDYEFERGRTRRDLTYIGTLGAAKWYNFNDNLTDLTKSFPHINVDLESKGEDDDDVWKMRYRNGESESVKGYIAFPDFKKLT